MEKKKSRKKEKEEKEIVINLQKMGAVYAIASLILSFQPIRVVDGETVPRNDFDSSEKGSEIEREKEKEKEKEKGEKEADDFLTNIVLKERDDDFLFQMSETIKPLKV
mmetsp:Transcript_18569/g.25684  ORF Transcript_18569/g.25684 Transcript_18569/m.25684 type:complete len:108 (+) Transcript_18569:73-396(+)